MAHEARREDGLSRDRIGGIARALDAHLRDVERKNREWRDKQQEVQQEWRDAEEARNRKRGNRLIRVVVLGFCMLTVLGGTTLLLNSFQASDINQSRLDGYRSSCIDSNDFRASIQALAVNLGAPTTVVEAALPLMPSCGLYARRRFRALQEGAEVRTFTAEARSQLRAETGRAPTPPPTP